MSFQNPELSAELAESIRIARRDYGSLCFHFTRGCPPDESTADFYRRVGLEAPDRPASAILAEILNSGVLRGNGKWSGGEPVVCFTEAPIAESANIFALRGLETCASDQLRYEPYGVAVSKKWLYSQGGRPVIYDGDATAELLPNELRYRFVKYDPSHAPDLSWEREWRVRTSELTLDAMQTLVVVPSTNEAFHFTYDFAAPEASCSEVGDVDGVLHSPRWLVVSLDIFGYRS